MHLTDEQVQRLLSGELSAPEASQARAHLVDCADCHGGVETALRDDAEVFALLASLDHAPRHVTASAVIARARRYPLAWANRAAAVLLMVSVAGVAWAAPRTRLVSMVEAVFHAIHLDRKSPAPARVVPVPTPNAAGIAVAPGRSLTVVFTSAQTAGSARVRLSDGSDVVVRAPAGSATFTSAGERLVIDNPRSTAGFEIEIPRAAPRVEIRVAGGRVFLKDGARITAANSAAADSVYVVSLSGKR